MSTCCFTLDSIAFTLFSFIAALFFDVSKWGILPDQPDKPIKFNLSY